MTYAVAIENFEGPFDLLLQLVENQQLDITNVSLAQATEPFLHYLEERRGQMAPEELADFLLIAAKLVYLKSKAIVPGLEDAELDEGADLASQLRAYQVFVAAAKQLQALAAEGVHSFSRPKQIVKREAGFAPPTQLGTDDLRALFAQVVRRLEPLVRLPKAAIERVVTLEEKMAELVERVQQAVKTSFHSMASHAKNKAELIVTFLALLELTKQRTLQARQTNLFEDIEISHL